MPNLLVKPNGDKGHVTHVSPETAGWTYVGFDVHHLSDGETLEAVTTDREACLVVLSGKATISAGGEDFGEMGGRPSPFEGTPEAVYVPGDSNWSVTAVGGLELAICSAPSLKGGLPPRAIRSDALTQEVRGKGSNTRHVTNIITENDPADSLLVVEVITPNGNTSSYPPHKHDADNIPEETFLEETYYHRLNPSQGFAFQRVYTDDRSLDEAMAVENGDVVMVPKGYHPTATCHGYDLYYLNVMAGPKRKWIFNNAKEHEWMFEK